MSKVDLKAVFAGLDTEGLDIYPWENEVRVGFPASSARLDRKAALAAGQAMTRLGVQTGLGSHCGVSSYYVFRLP